MDAKSSSALLTHLKGLGSAFQRSAQFLIPLMSSFTLWWTLRWRYLVVRAENHLSTWFIHDEYVGVKWNAKRGCGRFQVDSATTSAYFSAGVR